MSAGGSLGLAGNSIGGQLYATSIGRVVLHDVQVSAIIIAKKGLIEIMRFLYSPFNGVIAIGSNVSG